MPTDHREGQANAQHVETTADALSTFKYRSDTGHQSSLKCHLGHSNVTQPHIELSHTRPCLGMAIRVVAQLDCSARTGKRGVKGAVPGVAYFEMSKGTPKGICRS